LELDHNELGWREWGKADFDTSKIQNTLQVTLFHAFFKQIRIHSNHANAKPRKTGKGSYQIDWTTALLQKSSEHQNDLLLAKLTCETKRFHGLQDNYLARKSKTRVVTRETQFRKSILGPAN
jgi:hypothetical protein